MLCCAIRWWLFLACKSNTLWQCPNPIVVNDIHMNVVDVCVLWLHWGDTIFLSITLRTSQLDCYFVLCVWNHFPWINVCFCSFLLSSSSLCSRIFFICFFFVFVKQSMFIINIIWFIYAGIFHDVSQIALCILSLHENKFSIDVSFSLLCYERKKKKQIEKRTIWASYLDKFPCSVYSSSMKYEIIMVSYTNCSKKNKSCHIIR